MKYQLGSNSGKLVLPILEKAEEEIFVCSPFLSPEYARVMNKKAEQGIKVNVVTTDTRAGYHKKALEILEPPRKPQSRWIALFVLAGIFVALSALWTGVLIIAGGLAFVGYYSRKEYKKKLTSWKKKIKNRKINVIKNSNVHAKLYGTDGRIVAVGSPNLTPAGLRRHIEYVELKEGDDAKKLIEDFRNKLLD